jgi:DNA-binding NtrC family response regulator
VILPDETGLDLFDRLQLEDPGLKVIFCSGYTNYKSQWPLIQDRGLPFIQKPYTLQRLFQHVSTTLSKDPD